MNKAEKDKLIQETRRLFREDPTYAIEISEAAHRILARRS